MELTDVVPTEPASDSIPYTDVVSAFSALGAALFALLTLVVAIVAARYAKKQVDGLRGQLDVATDQLTVASDQLEEARTLRREQAQPYVVVSAEPNQTTPEVVEVVVKNYGTTGASQVTITCTPPLVRTDQAGGAQPVTLPDLIPFLAPGQEWRTFWDHGSERSREIYDLPTRHDVVVTFTDSFGKVHEAPSVLDWSVFMPRMFLTVKTTHHGVKELEKIETHLGKLAGASRVAKVAVYDGPKYDQDRAAAQAESWRRHEALVAELLPGQVDEPTEDQGGERSDTEPTS